MSKTADTRYSFETAPTRQTLQRASEMTQKLLLRLGLDASASERIGDEDHRLLRAFATACHLNIDWYDRHRKRQQRLYLAFGIFTGLLVLAMPGAIFLAHSKASDALAGQIGVIITGMLSAHRALSSALEKRNMARHFWKAQADMKSILYAFEDRWRNRATQASSATSDDGARPADAISLSIIFAPEFIEDLIQKTREAQDVKEQEQEVFFSQADTPFSNIAEILGIAHRSSKDFTEAAEEDKRQRASRTARVRELTATMRTIERQRDSLSRELEGLEEASDERARDRQRNLRSTLEGLERREMELEIDLAVAREQAASAD